MISAVHLLITCLKIHSSQLPRITKKDYKKRLVKNIKVIVIVIVTIKRNILFGKSLFPVIKRIFFPLEFYFLV